MGPAQGAAKHLLERVGHPSFRGPQAGSKLGQDPPSPSGSVLEGGLPTHGPPPLPTQPHTLACPYGSIVCGRWESVEGPHIV